MSQTHYNFEIVLILTKIHKEVTYAQDQNSRSFSSATFHLFFFSGRVIDIRK